MKFQRHPGLDLLDSNGRKGALCWLAVVAGFVASGIVGQVTEQSWITLNAYIVGYGLYHVIVIWLWLGRLERHIVRSAQILKEYSQLSAEAILARDEIDRPLAYTALQAICIKLGRHCGDSHRSILKSLETSLLDELNASKRAAKVMASMGLVGTCWGMMLTLQVIGKGSADVSDMEAVTQAVGGSLPAMSLAVSTTLGSAFVGSFLLSGMLMEAQSKLEKFVDQLDAQLDMFPIR